MASSPARPGVRGPAAFEALLMRHCRFLNPTDKIGYDVPLTALGVDSLEVVELIVELEDEFRVAIPQELLTPEVFATPGTIWTALRGLIGDRR